MPTYLFGSVGNGAVIKDGLSDVINHMLRNLDDGIAQRVLDRVEGIVAQAEPQVPVLTGKLRASLDSYVRASESDIAVGARMGGSRAPYAFKVRFKRAKRLAFGNPRRKGVRVADLQGPRQYAPGITPYAGQNVFQVLIRRPILQSVDALAEDVVAAMVEAAK